MNKKTQLGFIHRFIPSSKSSSTRTTEQQTKRKNSYATLLLLHGTGGNEEDLIPVGQQIAPYAAVLSVRGKVLENGMPRFFRRLAEGIFDIEYLKFRTNELADFVEQASKTYGFDLQRLIAVGYSNGANGAKLAQWIDQNNIKVNVDRTFSLDEAGQALDYQKDVHPRSMMPLSIKMIKKLASYRFTES